MTFQAYRSLHSISRSAHLLRTAQRSFPAYPSPSSTLSGQILTTPGHFASGTCYSTGTKGTPRYPTPTPPGAIVPHCTSWSPVPQWTRAADSSNGARQVPQPSATRPAQLSNGVSYSLVTLAIFSLAGVLLFSSSQKPVKSSEPTELTHPDTMAAKILEGRPGNLTPEQEEKLRKLWTSLFHLCGISENTEAPSSTDASINQAETDAPKKKRFGMFRKNRGDSKSSNSSPLTAENAVKNADEDDKYGQTKQFQETLARMSPEQIREAVWTMVKHDHPDALALRFLRARKWDVDKALVMMVSTLNWRQTEMRVDDDIMKKGEAGALADEKEGDGNAKKAGHDFLEQMRLGKSFLHNSDKNGRPICNVRVRLHRQGEQSEESLERYTVYLIETTRMVLSPPVDTATIIFDMTGFSMANMDYAPVKFMIKCFEANYPESLGAVLVHNSPWLFQGIWKVIRGWLDPVVAGKVHFTNNRADLEEFIDGSRIIKELEGGEDWEYKYIEPVSGENDKMKDTEARDKLIAAREDIVKQFEAATLAWIKNPAGDEVKAIKDKRETLASQLKDNYWQVDPYVRARSLYDRQGILGPDGKVTWDAATAPKTDKPSAPETSTDDLD